jgi:hypothetical protein
LEGPTVCILGMKVKMEAAGISETSVTTYKSTKCHNPQDHNLMSQRTAPLAFVPCDYVTVTVRSAV